ncbi:unnamed protein product [Fusarium venenatum]|uniref:Uncharacterized protein n=1 Tax=Fusarium venenatum TaxID=56646 RepID=A0A2L2TWK6_9HYPO|nr:uncharacterized protein FVRRES_10434 [Fusarium venenatum]CEI70357.1 unnamed protein product [Fusarium venenatum]
MSLLIGKGDVIFVRDVELDNQPIVVEWQQWFATNTERYIPAQYRGSDGTNNDITGNIFIQVSKADDFRRKHDRSEDMYTVRIDRDFQYGQNKEKTKRFLCRFVESLVTAAGEEAARFALSLGIHSGKDIVEWAKKYMGDDLRDF